MIHLSQSPIVRDIRKMAEHIKSHGGRVQSVWFPDLEAAKGFWAAMGGDWEKSFRPLYGTRVDGCIGTLSGKRVYLIDALEADKL